MAEPSLGDMCTEPNCHAPLTAHREASHWGPQEQADPHPGVFGWISTPWERGCRFCPSSPTSHLFRDGNSPAGGGDHSTAPSGNCLLFSQPPAAGHDVLKCWQCPRHYCPGQLLEVPEEGRAEGGEGSWSQRGLGTKDSSRQAGNHILEKVVGNSASLPARAPAPHHSQAASEGFPHCYF